jgi:hypothetical protein
MTCRADSIELMPGVRRNRAALRRTALIVLAPLLAYGLVRPLVGSDALALGIAGVIPVTYSIVLAAARRRIDPLALLTAIGFSLASVASVIAGGSSLPLKLHEAAITFGIGLVMLVAVVIGRPLPAGRLLRIPSATKAIDSALGAMIGGFLVLHALLHLALAASLSTSSYIVVSRVVDWGTIAAGALVLSAYVRHLRARPTPDPESRP